MCWLSTDGAFQEKPGETQFNLSLWKVNDIKFIHTTPATASPKYSKILLSTGESDPPQAPSSGTMAPSAGNSSGVASDGRGVFTAKTGLNYTSNGRLWSYIKLSV